MPHNAPDSGLAYTRSPIISPPDFLNEQGERRRIGVEIEFAGLESAAAAEVVRQVFGGSITVIDKHACRVDTDLGQFAVELDMSRAHPGAGAGAKDGKPAFFKEVETHFASAVGDIGRYWMPQEIGSPPIAIDQLGRIDDLVAALRRSGALGTTASPLYGFGVHLNPETPSARRGTVLAHLKAYLLCSDWLHSRIGMDRTRRMMRFVAPFPQAYVRMVVDPDYNPSLPDMMVDYFRFNPTRNREFDMLPLFAYMDSRRVAMLSSGKPVKARPTYHYRLPDSRVDRVDWGGIVTEWNRWVHVEWLASDTEALAAAGEKWRLLHGAGKVGLWKDEVENWLVTPR